MDHHRIADITARIEREKENAILQNQNERQRQAIENRFRRAWETVYLEQEDDKYVDVIAARLIELGQGAVERNWDYFVGELLSLKNLNPYFEIALIILRWSCVGDFDRIRECLIAQLGVVHIVRDVHAELYHKFSHEMNSPPLTPPLNQPEISALLGITPSKFRSQFRAKKWRTKDEGRGHSRKWWNVDKNLQLDVLRAIRVKMPNKIWLNNRPENRNPVEE